MRHKPLSIAVRVNAPPPLKPIPKKWMNAETRLYTKPRDDGRNVPDSEVVPGARDFRAKRCDPAGGGDKTKKNKENWRLRKCHTELIFIAPEAAAKWEKKLAEAGKPAKIPSGPALRICTDLKADGMLIPVRGWRDANEKSGAYCRALKQITDAQSRELRTEALEVVRKHAGNPPAFGGTYGSRNRVFGRLVR